MPSLVILGAGGFLGRAVLAAANPAPPIKAVAHNRRPGDDPMSPGVSWFHADLLVPAALDEILSAGDVVANLALSSPARCAPAPLFHRCCCGGGPAVACDRVGDLRSSDTV
jgi:uncharacterized protein YbjT (DUF2867 family)